MRLPTLPLFLFLLLTPLTLTLPNPLPRPQISSLPSPSSRLNTTDLATITTAWTTHCHRSGKWIWPWTAQVIIDTFCEHYNGVIVPGDGKIQQWYNTVNSMGYGIKLHLGYETLASSLSQSGWVIRENECKMWMKDEIVAKCYGNHPWRDTQGGKFWTSSGVVWVDPQADMPDVWPS